MEYRNAKYNRHGTINCEVNHPKFGWIPYTASPDDVEELGKELYAEVAKGEVAEYEPPPPQPEVIPDRVTARQFKMQLEKDGLLSSVEAWVGQQEKLVQIAYQNSGTFVRTEPMMEAGFAALRFESAQIDAFFTAASAL
jgi:hypothetical protein